MSTTLTRRYTLEVRHAGLWLAVASYDSRRDATFARDVKTCLWGVQARIFDNDAQGAI